MKKLLIILDPAHGSDELGKRSPDGTHREYKWSRKHIASIKNKLEAIGYQVKQTTFLETEPGLSNRLKSANKISGEHKDLIPLFISLHNAAAGDGTKWMQARGISVWTCKGRTRSDIFASDMIKTLNGVTKNRTQMRTYSPKPQEQDFEANFTVLMGNYNAMLIECCFQDNKEDVELLQDEAFCQQLEDAIIEGIEKIESSLN